MPDALGFADRFASQEGVAYLDAASQGPLPLAASRAGRYDAHETASFNNLMPLAESLRLLLEATPTRVQAHVRALLDRLLQALVDR